MIIDAHSHVYLPVEKHLDIMDSNGIDKTVLFATSIHPERIINLGKLKEELKSLSNIVSGFNNANEIKNNANCELAEVIRNYPDKYIGFGTVPHGLDSVETCHYIQEYVIQNNFRGLGEFTVPSGSIGLLDSVFRASMEFGALPVWIHAFNPLIATDIIEIAELARRFPDIPVIIGHMGGSNWLTAAELAQEVQNIFLDTSACFSTLVLKFLLNAMPDKCIFGVDMPYGDIELSKAAIMKLCNDRAAVDAVLGGNISKILKI